MAIEEIEIEGFVGQNPKYPSEKYPEMLSFSVAVSQSVKNKVTNEWETKTSWYNVVSWEKSKSDYLFSKVFKGDKVVVKGKPSVRTYTSKDGELKAMINIDLSKIAVMKKPQDSEINSEPISQTIHSDQYASGKFPLTKKKEIDIALVEFDDDIPF